MRLKPFQRTTVFALGLLAAGIARGQAEAPHASSESSAAPAGATCRWNVRDHVPLAEFVVQSHRGAGVLAPENTVVAFELAWKLGTVPEADLRMSKDGVIVAFHDDHFGRLVKEAGPELKNKRVADLTWAELRQLDVGSWKAAEFAGCRIPSADELFARVAMSRKRRVYLDIKEIDLERLAAAVRRAGIESQVILASTDYALVRRWKGLVPASGTLLWMGGDEPALVRRIDGLRGTQFADVTQLQIHVQARKTPAGEKLVPSETFLVRTGEILHLRGIVFQALPLERSDAAIYWRLMDLGVASFATDYPDRVLEAIRQYYGKASR